MTRRPEFRSEVLNVLAAAIVALLIWAYANDRTRESATVTGTVRIAASDPRATFVEPTGAITVSMEVRGSRRSIERVGDMLREGLSLSTGTEGVPAQPGVYTIELQDMLGENTGIAASGIEIAQTTPQSFRLQIGALVTDQVPVTPVLPRASVQGEIIVDPPVVAVTLPEAARDAVGAIALDAMVDTKNLEPGRTHAIDVELKLPETLSRWKELTRIVPPRAKVSFTLLATTAEFTVATVPVEIAVTPAALETYAISLPAGSTAITNVVVTGPLASIDRLRKAEFTPAAVVALAPRALVPGTRRQPVTFWRMPEGVSVVTAAGAPVTSGSSPVEVVVEVKLRERTEPAAPASAP